MYQVWSKSIEGERIIKFEVQNTMKIIKLSISILSITSEKNTVKL